MSLGKHKLRMELEKHLPREEVLDVTGAEPIVWDLAPCVGWLSVKSDPAGLNVVVALEARRPSRRC